MARQFRLSVTPAPAAGGWGRPLCALASASSAAFVSKRQGARSGSAFGLRDRDQELFGGGKALPARRGHLEPQAHALLVVLEQMAGHGKGVAFLRLPEIMQHHLQRIDGLAALPPRRGVEPDAVHERVARAAEHERIGRVVHVAVIVHPFGDHGCIQYRKRSAVPHGVLPKRA